MYSLPSVAGTTTVGNFDGLNIDKSMVFVSGWAFDSAAPEQPVTVVVMSDERVIGTGIACTPRPDVHAAGAPHPAVGFRISIRCTGEEKYLKVLIERDGQQYLLHQFQLSEPLPACELTREDVISTFRLLFHRDPEDEEVINQQLSKHKTKQSLFVSLFRSPEFHEKNMDVIAHVQKKSVKK